MLQNSVFRQFLCPRSGQSKCLKTGCLDQTISYSTKKILFYKTVKASLSIPFLDTLRPGLWTHFRKLGVSKPNRNKVPESRTSSDLGHLLYSLVELDPLLIFTVCRFHSFITFAVKHTCENRCTFFCYYPILYNNMYLYEPIKSNLYLT